MRTAAMKVRLEKRAVGAGIEAGNGEELWAMGLLWNGLLTVLIEGTLIPSGSDSSVELQCSLKAKGGLSQLAVHLNSKQSAYFPKAFQH